MCVTDSCTIPTLIGSETEFRSSPLTGALVPTSLVVTYVTWQGGSSLSGGRGGAITERPCGILDVVLVAKALGIVYAPCWSGTLYRP